MPTALMYVENGLIYSVIGHIESRGSQVQKELVPEIHAAQYGLVRNSAASQWKSGIVLRNSALYDTKVALSGTTNKKVK